MPFPQAKPLHVSPLQQELLQRMVQRTTSAQRLVKRGHIILEAAKGMSNTQIAAHQQVDYETVRRWRDRWHAAQTRLQAGGGTRKAKKPHPGHQRLLHERAPPRATPNIPLL